MFSTDQEQVEYIMQEFDFNTVLKVMKYTNWQWYEAETNTFGVPSLSQIKTLARENLETIINNHGVTGSACGGFSAYRDEDDNRIRLEFILERV